MHEYFLMTFQGYEINHEKNIKINASTFEEAYKKAEKIFQELKPWWADFYTLGPMYTNSDLECFGLPETIHAFSETNMKVAEVINKKGKENKIALQINTNGTCDINDIVIRRI